VRRSEKMACKSQYDPSFKVHARTMTTIGRTGDERFIGRILAFICEWDEETYSKVGPVAALNGLKLEGLTKQIRERLREALEGSFSEQTTRHLRECLESMRTN